MGRSGKVVLKREIPSWLCVMEEKKGIRNIRKTVTIIYTLSLHLSSIGKKFKLSRQNPEYKQISVASGTASVSFNRFGNQRAADRYSFNTDNGEFTETNLYQHQDKSGKIRGWIYSVHVGNWGGMLTRILTFIAALIGASLPLTGYYLWVKKLMNKRKREKAISLSSVEARKIA